MYITGICGCRTGSEILASRSPADTGDGLQAGLYTDLCPHNTLGCGERLAGQVFVYPLHDGCPQSLGQIRLFARSAGTHAYVIVVTGPYAAGVIGREAGEPYVVVVCGSARLDGNGHGAAEVTAGAGTAFLYHVHHSIGEQESGGFLDDLL